MRATGTPGPDGIELGDADRRAGDGGGACFPFAPSTGVLVQQPLELSVLLLLTRGCPLTLLTALGGGATRWTASCPLFNFDTTTR